MIEAVKDYAIFMPDSKGRVLTGNAAAEIGGVVGKMESSEPFSGARTIEEVERCHILRVLEESGGNHVRAAGILGIDRRTLYRKLDRYV